MKDERTIVVHKADPIFAGEDVKTVVIRVEKKLPRARSLREAQMIQMGDAQAIFGWLRDCLPGGTLCDLGALIWAHKASYLAVPMRVEIRSDEDNAQAIFRWLSDEDKRNDETCETMKLPGI